MSKATGVTPKHLIGAPEACFAVVSRAITWRLDPFAVALATYQTPGGQIGFEGKLVHAILENSGKLSPSSGGIRYEHYGDWSKVQGRFKIVESQKQDSEGKPRKYAMPSWTDEDARAGKPADQTTYPLAQSCGVRVIAHLRGESKPRFLDFDLIQAQPRNSTLWATDPMTQICYTAVRRFASSVVPALMMGVPFDPVDNFGAPIDVTADSEREVSDDIPMPRAREAATEQHAGEQQQATSGNEPETKSADAQPAQSETKQTASETNARGDETGQQRDLIAGGNDSGPGPIASDAQRQTIIKIAKRNGLTVAQLDEHLIEKFSFGIDELPAAVVSKAVQLVSGIKAA
jgi:hypothetical protein